ncbi:MAG: LytTR family DNA-binding domain-containing protein [Acidobacteriia bacterium]|nr:LytTR family DNA-binding domain-containing protein [Terriglobia bacterium]
MRIRVLIVDDEVLARERIRDLLRGQPEFEIAGECANGRDAVQKILELAPDLLFLDVQMPGLNGLDVLEAVGPRHMPVVIFVTAYDQYALKAFEVHALDYLLKPFDRPRFQKSLQRARTQIERQRNGDLNDRLMELLEEVKGTRKFLDRLVVKDAGRIFFLKADEIDWVESAGNYLRLHVGKESHLLRETMGRFERQLDPSQFLRIHRSTIANIERVKEFRPLFHGEYAVVLHGGRQLTLSRAYRGRLDEHLRKGR